MERRKWLGCTLGRADAEKLKDWLRDKEISFEPSGFFNDVHIEVYVNEKERREIIRKLEEL